MSIYCLNVFYQVFVICNVLNINLLIVILIVLIFYMEKCYYF